MNSKNSNQQLAISIQLKQKHFTAKDAKDAKEKLC